MTDNEIIKAFEHVLKSKNNHIPITGKMLLEDTLDLINRQKEQISKQVERIEKKNSAYAKLEAEITEKDEMLKAQADTIFLYERVVKDKNAEIERYKGVIKLLERDVANAKTEGVKEFAHLLIDKAEPGGVIHVSDIPDYVMELREGKK